MQSFLSSLIQYVWQAEQESDRRRTASRAVATALDIPVQGGEIRAEGDLDFRGTLGVSKDALVGFKEVRLQFRLDSTASQEQIAKLIELTERYCVVLQTLRSPLTVKSVVGG